MTFTLFDDNYAEHPKVLTLTDGAFRLHTSAILYCSRHLTDGRVPKAVVPTLMPTYKASHVRELTGCGLWVSAKEGYMIHDYLEWNKSRAEVEALREKRRKAGKRGSEGRWGR